MVLQWEVVPHRRMVIMDSILLEDTHPTVGREGRLAILCITKAILLRTLGTDLLVHPRTVPCTPNVEAPKTVQVMEVPIQEAILHQCQVPRVLVAYDEGGSPPVLRRLLDLHRRDRMGLQLAHRRHLTGTALIHRHLTETVLIRVDLPLQCTMDRPKRTAAHRLNPTTCTEVLPRVGVNLDQDHHRNNTEHIVNPRQPEPMLLILTTYLRREVREDHPWMMTATVRSLPVVAVQMRKTRAGEAINAEG